jgi:dolichyl-phosphate-mannose-protein mannosyltransferase
MTVPPGDAGAYRSPFLRDFVHLNVAMMTSNNALVPDPDKQDDLASKFWQWPLLHVGLRMCSWDDKTVKYFLLGNPLVYWGSTASLGVFVLMVAWYALRWQRGFNDFKNIRELDQIHYAGVYPVIGWFLHYFPFILMGRVTYVHHYYPALWFAILTFGFCVDWSVSRLGKAAQWGIHFVLYAIVIGLFVLFKDISFGMVGNNQQWKYLKWFETWRITD